MRKSQAIPATPTDVYCVSVRAVPSGRWSYVAPAVYRVWSTPRGLVWRLHDGALDGRARSRTGMLAIVGYRSRPKAYERAYEAASALGCEVRVGVRHGAYVR